MGSSYVKCPTPRAETRLRCGEVALIPLQLVCTININNDTNSFILILTITFPKTGYPNDEPLDIAISNSSTPDNNERIEILVDQLREYCKQKIDNENYPRYF